MCLVTLADSNTVEFQTDRIFDIANVPFSQVADEEKLTYHAKMVETGSFQGYKLRQYWVRDTSDALIRRIVLQADHPSHAAHRRRRTRPDRDLQPYVYAMASELVSDNVNLTVNRDVTKKEHPAALRPFLPDLSDFAKVNHFNVLHTVLRRVALYCVPIHASCYDQRSQVARDWVRASRGYLG